MRRSSVRQAGSPTPQSRPVGHKATGKIIPAEPSERSRVVRSRCGRTQTRTGGHLTRGEAPGLGRSPTHRTCHRCRRRPVHRSILLVPYQHLIKNIFGTEDNNYASNSRPTRFLSPPSAVVSSCLLTCDNGS